MLNQKQVENLRGLLDRINIPIKGNNDQINREFFIYNYYAIVNSEISYYRNQENDLVLNRSGQLSLINDVWKNAIIYPHVINHFALFGGIYFIYYSNLQHYLIHDDLDDAVVLVRHINLDYYNTKNKKEKVIF